LSTQANPDDQRSRPSQARPAISADAKALGQSMARAFYDDPFVSYLVQGEGARKRHLARLFRLLFQLGKRYNSCDVTDGVEAAALWRPPNAWHVPYWQYVTNGATFLRVFGAGTMRVIAAMDQLERVHPQKPHWYLQSIGTDPAFQGKGYGGVLLRYRLERVDAARLPAYLESSKESNIPIYRSFGFEVTGEIRLPKGPTLYPMWRPARS
jgi:ribosomal protein S18 acetylase RimI-like enzyme